MHLLRTRAALLALAIAPAGCAGPADSAGEPDQGLPALEDVTDAGPPDARRPEDTGVAGDAEDAPDLPVHGDADAAEAAVDAVADHGPDVSEMPIEPYCLGGALRCLTTLVAQRCVEGGTHWEDAFCEDGEKCWHGLCTPVICEPAEAGGFCVSTNGRGLCNDVGTGWIELPCPEGQTCFEGGCVDWECHPGDRACYGMVAVRECREDGSGWDVDEHCDIGGRCSGDQCVPACTVAEETRSTVACDFLTTGLGGAGLLVTTSAEQPDALVTLEEVVSGEPVEGPITLFAGSTTMLPLAAGAGPLRVSASVPVAIHELGGWSEDLPSPADGTLLLPHFGLGSRYVVQSWPSQAGAGGVHEAWIRLTAGGSDPVEAVVHFRAHARVGSKPLVWKPGQVSTVTIAPGERLEIRTAGDGEDLTGTIIEADGPLAVLSGHDCARVPAGAPGCAPMAEQLVPISRWGTRVACVPFEPRSAHPVDLWRIVAAEDDTLITTDPPQPGYELVTLAAGAWITVAGSEPFVVSASRPISVAHLLAGANLPGHGDVCNGQDPGAPALELVAPVDQHLRRAVVAVAPEVAERYATVVQPVGNAAVLGGMAVSGEPIGDSGLTWARVPIEPGVYGLTSTYPVGVGLHAWSCGAAMAATAASRVRSFAEAPPPTFPLLPTEGDTDGDGALDAFDCAPEDPSTSPYAAEACGGGDEDCDGETDEPGAIGCATLFADQDGDGAGAAGFALCLCTPVQPYVTTIGGDCDDTDPNIHPWRVERCDGSDDNCNGLVDDGCDDDGDGYCDAGHPVAGAPAVCTLGAGDCLDESPLVSPGVAEADGNGLDDDCDGLTDGEVPADVGPDCEGIPCTGGTVQALLCAVELCYGPLVVSSPSVLSVTSSSLESMAEAVPQLAAAEGLGPRAGASLLVLSTGTIGGPASVDVGGAATADLLGAGLPPIYDSVELRVTLTPPEGATGLRVDTRLISAEPAGTSPSDRLYILLEGADGLPELVNAGPCAAPDGPGDLAAGGCAVGTMSGLLAPCEGGEPPLNGFGCASGGAWTGWLRTSAALPDEGPVILTIRLVEGGDGLLDTMALIDAFAWLTGPVTPGTLPAP